MEKLWNVMDNGNDMAREGECGMLLDKSCSERVIGNQMIHEQKGGSQMLLDKSYSEDTKRHQELARLDAEFQEEEKRIGLLRRELNKILGMKYEEKNLANRELAQVMMREGLLISDEHEAKVRAREAVQSYEEAHRDYNELKSKHAYLRERRKEVQAEMAGLKLSDVKYENGVYLATCEGCGEFFTLKKIYYNLSRYCGKCRDKIRNNLVVLAELGGQYSAKDVKIIEDEEFFHIYYGGEGSPDGEGHGHVVIRKEDFQITYRRESRMRMN